MRYITAFAALVAGAALASAAPICASRQYLDAATGLCKQCPSDALTCSSATVALSCQRGSFLTANKDCVTANKCPPKTFADGAGRTCKSCYQVNAATCSDGSPTGATACDSGSCLSAGKCLYANRIRPGFYCPDNVLTACKGGDGVSKCNSDGIPTSCKPGYNLATMRATCVKCNGFEEFDPVSQECFCPSGTYKTDVVGCAHCTDFGSLVDACTDTGPTHCMPGARLYEGQCLASCPAGTLPHENTCLECNDFVGTSCDLAKAESCGLLFDETTMTCVRTCRAFSDGVLLSATVQDGSICRSCGSPIIDSCDAFGPQSCRAPYLRNTEDYGATPQQCITRDECLGLNPQYAARYEPSYVGEYQVGVCLHCAPTHKRSEDGSSCVRR